MLGRDVDDLGEATDLDCNRLAVDGTVRCSRSSPQRTTARTCTPKSLRHLRLYPARSSCAAVASAIALVSATGVLPVARLLSAQADCGSWCRDCVIRSRGGAPRRPASGAAASVMLR